jgi:glycosidase
MRFAPFALSALVSFPCGAAEPSVSRVSPPEWFVGHSMNPVRCLVEGRGLTGARVESGDPGLAVSRVSVNPRGTALFFDLKIDPKAAPGPRTLRVATAEGAANAPFVLEAPLPRPGRFQGFSNEDVFYLIMVDRFANGDPENDDPAVSRGLLDRSKTRYYHGGDLQGILDHLPYLKDLGVSVLWLTPLYDNANRLNDRQKVSGEAVTDYHGYGAVDFYSVEEHFGSVALLRKLVDAAHALGLKVVLDQVANHTGPDHRWVDDPPTPTWFHGSRASHLENHWETWTLADPHATAETRRETLEGWFVGVLPDLNQDDPEVARYLIENTLWWVGVSGADGIREDTLPYVPRSFWRSWRASLKREYPDLSVVGEMWNDDPALVSFFQGGRARSDGIDSGIESLFDFPLLHAARQVFAKGAPATDLASLLGRDFLYPSPEKLVTFIGNHDTSRFRSEGDVESLKLALTFVLTSRGIPLLYYGDEIGLAGGEDPDNRRDFPGGFPGDPRSAFSRAGRTDEEEGVFEHVRTLLHLRRELGALRHGALRDLLVTDTLYAFVREAPSGRVVVALNLGREPVTVDLSSGTTGLPPGTVFVDRLGGGPSTGRTSAVALPPRSGAVLVPREP